MPAVRRRLVLVLLAAAALVAGGCASGDDDATSGATGAVSVPTRAQLPVAPSTRVGLPTAPPTSAPAATTTTAPPDPPSVKVTAGSYATCPTRTKGQTCPAPLVVLGVDGTLKWTVCTLAAA